MHPPAPPLSAEGRGERVEPPTKFSKRGGDLTGPQLLEAIAVKEGVTFFRGRVCNFHTKKLKSEIFNDKKSL